MQEGGPVVDDDFVFLHQDMPHLLDVEDVSDLSSPFASDLCTFNHRCVRTRCVVAISCVFSADYL